MSGLALRISTPAPVGLGPFRVDVLSQLLGCSLADLLGPLLVAAPSRQPSPTGPAVLVHDLELPDGEGVELPLGGLGAVGFFADGGLLRLTCPLPALPALLRRVGSSLVHGPTEAEVDGARVAVLWLHLRPGLRAAIPLGFLGELAIEAG